MQKSPIISINEPLEPLKTPIDDALVIKHQELFNANESPTQSLKVCQECQKALIGAFEHCLSHHGEPIPLTSFHEIDEFEDSKQLTEQPYFDIMKDPTIVEKPSFKDVQHQIQMDRWIHADTKQSKERCKSLKNQMTNELTMKKQRETKSYSGAIYKRMLEFKDKEIYQLKRELYERHQSQEFDTKNMQRLKKALNKAVHYYTFAEEWQQKESQRLVKDIEFLKQECSSLMAFLIHAENEKQSYMTQIDTLNALVYTRDEKILELQGIERGLRDKLHESFKEFIAMNETMTRLKKEAIKGSDAAESRNEMLQRNLDRIAQDFELTTRDLNASHLKMKELEFEMEELVQQFNSVGEGKKKSEELNVKITNDLSMTQKKLQETEEELEQLKLVKSKLEADLRNALETSANTKANLENRIAGLEQDLTIALSQKSDLELIQRQNKAENERLSSALKEKTKQKDALDVQLKSTETRAEKEIQQLNLRIKELDNAKQEDAKLIKKLQDAKEQMRVQVTELQNSLDREVSNMNVLSFETAQARRQYEDRILILEDQVEKLTNSKATLTNERKQLTEKLKSIKLELKEKEEELDYTNSAYKKAGEEALQNGIQQSNLISNLEATLLDLHQKHSDLQLKFKEASELNVTLETQLISTQTQLHETQQSDQCNAQLNQKLNLDIEVLKSEHMTAIKDRNHMKIHLDSVLSKIDDLTQTIKNMEKESLTTNKEKDNEIARLINDNHTFKEQDEKLKELTKTLKQMIHELDQELGITKLNFLHEQSAKEKLEFDNFELKNQLHNEKRQRHDMERFNAKLERSNELNVLERLSLFKVRDLKLSLLAQGMNSQLNHLNSITQLLPEQLNFGETEPPEIPLFQQQKQASRRMTIKQKQTRMSIVKPANL